MTEKLEFPEVSHSELIWRNQVLGKRRRIGMQFGPCEVVAEFVQRKAKRTAHYLEFAIGDEAVYIGVDDLDELTFVSKAVLITSFAEMPAEIVEALIEAVFEAPLAALTSEVGSPCQFVGVGTQDRLPDGLTHLSLRVEIDGALAVIADFASSVPTLQLVADLLHRVPTVASIEADSIPLLATCELGRTRIEIDAIRSLKVHDVVLIDELYFGSPDEFVMSVGANVHWRVKRSDSRLQLLEPTSRPPSAAQGVDACIECSFHADSLLLTVNQVEKLSAGDQIAMIFSQKPTLMLDHRPVAAGSLVQIGQNYGMRLERFTAEIGALAVSEQA